MRWLIFALGVALALGGAASIVSGVPYIRMEFGWTEVIAGTTALSAGIVTVAIGAILSALRRVEKSFVADVAIRTDVVAADPVGDLSDFVGQEPDLPVPSASERDISPSPVTRTIAERIWSKPSSKGMPGSDKAEALVPVQSFRSTERPSGLRTATLDASPQPEFGEFGVAAPRSYSRPAAASPTRTDDRVPSLIPSPHTPATAEATPPEAPTVVGRYESGGASYVLFSDGTIEVETEVGLHRFGSMEELKAYIDQQQQSANN